MLSRFWHVNHLFDRPPFQHQALGDTESALMSL